MQPAWTRQITLSSKFRCNAPPSSSSFSITSFVRWPPFRSRINPHPTWQPKYNKNGAAPCHSEGFIPIEAYLSQWRQAPAFPIFCHIENAPPFSATLPAQPTKPSLAYLIKYRQTENACVRYIFPQRQSVAAPCSRNGVTQYRFLERDIETSQMARKADQESCKLAEQFSRA